MHATLAEILENQKSGLLWVTHDGIVRYANGDACSRTGLAGGSKLYDPDLVHAVERSALQRVSASLTVPGRPTALGEAIPELRCRVVPGLAKDDAFVFMRDESSTDPGIAYENLMEIIRTDLREPLRTANEALTLLDPEVAHLADQAVSQMHEVLQALDKLLDLAGLWHSGALLATDRIELWPLLQSVWGELQPHAIQRGIKVRFQSQDETANLATLYGSETWLKRVFMECLEGALRTAPRGSNLVIEHRQLGPRALIVFRDCGVFAAHIGGIEMEAPRAPSAKPDKAGKPNAAAARDRLGFQLCRHVLSLHGGQLREEVEDESRHFLIDLPTGAPARNTDPQIDIAQAQRYASDLAALMARARRKAA